MSDRAFQRPAPAPPLASSERDFESAARYAALALAPATRRGHGPGAAAARLRRRAEALRAVALDVEDLHFDAARGPLVTSAAGRAARPERGRDGPISSGTGPMKGRMADLSPDELRRDRAIDRSLYVVGWLLMFWTWLTDRRYKDRLADVEIPHGMLAPIVMSAAIRRREWDRAIARFDKLSSQFGTFIGTWMRESAERQRRLVELQANLEAIARSGEERERTMVALQISVEKYTRRLVVLTIVVAVLGAGAIGATIWAATR
jgi:hypothetical protein